jgi:nuclear transport factor 2 (NTF2) superfamily protein
MNTITATRPASEVQQASATALMTNESNGQIEHIPTDGQVRLTEAEFIQRSKAVKKLKERAADDQNYEMEKYLWGYKHGLSRARFGEIYGQQEHDRLMSYGNSDPSEVSEHNRNIGRGYRDGLAMITIDFGNAVVPQSTVV